MKLVPAVPLLAFFPVAVALAGSGVADGRSDRPEPPPIAAETQVETAISQRMAAASMVHRASPAGRAEREESRTAYESMDRREALALARRKLAGVFAGPAFERMRIPPGLRVADFIGSTGAVLEGKRESDNQFVEAVGLPLSSDLGSGRRDLLDLKLHENGDGFVPRNPAVPTRISRTGDVRVGRPDVGIQLVSDETPDEPLDASGRVFLANALHDADLTATPTPLGVSIAFQIRSAEAPERVVLDFDLPARTRLRAADNKTDLVEVVRGDTPIGQVHPPSAWDADGKPVAVAYDVRPSQLIVRFAHRGHDLRYPLYVDPLYEDFGSYLGRGWDEWGTSVVGAWSLSQGSPLSISSATGYFNGSEWAGWSWRNPRGYISSVGWASVSHTSSWPYWSCTRTGILRSGWSGWKSYWQPACPTAANYTNQFPTNTTGENSYDDWAILQIWMHGAGNRATSGRVTAYGARVTLEDRESPSVASSANVPNSTGGAWVGPNRTITVNPSASDGGLGMYAFNLYLPATVRDSYIQPNGSATTSSGLACSGLRGARCPTGTVTGAIQFNSNDQYEGARSVGGNAYDRLGKATAYYSTVRIDRSTEPPALSGMLADNAGKTTPPADYPLRVNAGDQYSGVKSIEIFVNGQSQKNASNPSATDDGYVTCGGSCPTLELNWTLNGFRYAGGQVDVEVVTTDEVGNVRKTPLSLTMGPTCDAAGYYAPTGTQFPMPCWHENGEARNLPNARRMQYGTVEDVASGGINAYADAGGPGGIPVAPGTKRRIVDSFANTLAYVERADVNTWNLYKTSIAGETPFATTSRAEAQGFGCMLAPASSDQWIMTAFPGQGNVRAFVLKSSYSDITSMTHKDNGQPRNLNDYNAGCGSPKNGGTTLFGTTLDPNPAAADMASPVDPAVGYLSSESPLSPPLVRGGNYGLYNVRQYYEGAPRVRPIAAASTAIRGGGVLRAIVPASGSVNVQDQFLYSDPNACSSTKPARWAYGQYVYNGQPQALWGLIARQSPEPGVPIGSC